MRLTSYKRQCPQCDLDIYTNKYGYYYGLKNNSPCRSCSMMGSNNHRFGISPSSTTREKIGRGISGDKNGNYGKHFSEETKNKLSKSLMGKNHPNFGKKRSQEFCRKLRISNLVRLEKLGIVAGVDRGASKFFQYQNEQGYRFIENYPLKELGYIVDGYDPTQHVICEFDTEYHDKPCQKRKDIERQAEIVRYFNSIGIPLNGFYRYSKTQKQFNRG